MQTLKFDSNGLLTAVAQDAGTGQVLMVAMMDAQAVDKTIKTKKAHFWSRSRKELWQKGETSGNFLDVQEIKIDCDGDALLLQVIPRGPACHTGNVSCFYSDLDGQNAV
jgi:phosphoribosyl-AMP cyclohydrolase